MRKIADIRIDMFKKQIDEIEIDFHNRSELPALLLGLQEIYRNTDRCGKILRALESLLPKDVSKTLGREGMNVWQIFVLGSVRLASDCDYDVLSDLAGNHNVLRQFLHNCGESRARYPRQTLADNLTFFTREVLQKINVDVVNAGYEFCGIEGPLDTRADSFVLESDVHFPSDTGLMLDGISSIIRLVKNACQKYGLSGWRKYKSMFKKI